VYTCALSPGPLRRMQFSNAYTLRRVYRVRLLFTLYNLCSYHLKIDMMRAHGVSRSLSLSLPHSSLFYLTNSSSSLAPSPSHQISPARLNLTVGGRRRRGATPMGPTCTNKGEKERSPPPPDSAGGSTRDKVAGTKRELRWVTAE
jgi:hypothetical protein